MKILGLLLLIFLARPVWAQPLGNALVFDGLNDYVDCGNHASLNMSTEVTLEAWVLTSAIGNSRIISKWGTNSGYEMAFLIDQIWFNINQRQRAFYAAVNLVDQWTHLAVTYDGVNSAIYINGELVDARINSQENIVNTGLNLKIGNISNTASSYFSGSIDEVRVWNRERTQAQIQSTMNTTLGPPYYSSQDSGLVGYWQFEEGEGDIAYDLSVHGNNGTIYGATWAQPAGIDTTPPAAPQNLTAARSRTQITLNWNRNSEEDFKHYRIYQSTSPNASVLIDSTTGGISDTSLVINGLSAGTTYYFRVTAVDSSNNVSDFSDEISASLIPVYVPDTNFRSVLGSNYGISFDENNIITNPATAAVLTSLDVSAQNISTLEGIEAFTGLQILRAYENQITDIDVSMLTALTNLDCAFNQLSDLDVSSNTLLRELGCHGNQLTTLDLSSNTLLRFLVCYENQLTGLDVTANKDLRGLHCNANPIGSLDLSQNTALTNLQCINTGLTKLDVSGSPLLDFLECQLNRIPIILTDGSITTISKDDITQVAAFRDSTQNPTVAAGETGAYVLGSSGAIVNITENTAGETSISSTTGTNPAIVGELPDGVYSISDAIYWRISNPDFAGSYNLILDLTPVPVAVNFDSVRVLMRDNDATPWQDASRIGGVSVQYLEPFILVNGLTTFAEFALGNTYSAPLSFDLHLPLDGDTLTNLVSPVEFSWQPTSDPEGATVNYSLHISGGSDRDTTINVLTDTMFSFAGSEWFEYVSEYQWHVLASNGQYTTSSADSFRFHTPANRAPLSFNLLKPADNDTLTDLSTPIDFVWQAAVDPDGDPVEYSLHISGGTGRDTTINALADTMFSFDGSAWLEFLSGYQWQVEATDGEHTISSADSFVIFTPVDVTGLADSPGEKPKTFSLEQNYPNPFNPATKITFNLPQPENVKLSVLNIRGQKVQQLVNANMPAGRHQVEFDAQQLPSGVYFYVIDAGRFHQVRKMILIK